MTPSAKRDRLVTFHSVSTSENAFGEPVDDASYPQLSSEWARVIYGKGEERRSAAIEGSNQPATFVVLSNIATRAVTTKDIIKFNGATWDIVSVAPFERAEIEFTAVRRAP